MSRIYEEYREGGNGLSVTENEDGVYVDMLYPRWTKDHRSEMTIWVDQESVRATGGIGIQYDYERDGYVILQVPHREEDWGMGETGPPEEVAFIPAWLERFDG